MGWAHLFVGPASDPEFGKLAGAHHIFVVPTLSVLQTICATRYDAGLADDPRLKPYLTPSASAAMKRSFGMAAKISCEGADQAVRQLKTAHVPFSRVPTRAIQVPRKAPAFTASWNCWCAPD
ncbi:MAG: hypothetical protein LAQ69_16775 [Acidobacteriia bacterium]|nr:hypothetical protein [Terriglobia bacterium]